jgi:uncharacterized membrane protein HdeD (DUF308 family)
VLVFFWSGISLLVPVMLFSGYALADGLFALVSAIEKATDKTSERKHLDVGVWPTGFDRHAEADI